MFIIKVWKLLTSIDDICQIINQSTNGIEVDKFFIQNDIVKKDEVN